MIVCRDPPTNQPFKEEIIIIVASLDDDEMNDYFVGLLYSYWKYGDHMEP